MVIPGLLCAAFFLNGLNDALQNSAVADELGGHTAAGYLYWSSGQYTGGIANFPLGHLLIALPVVLLGRSYELFTEQHLVLFRLPVLLMGLLLGVALYRFTAELFGKKAGLTALALLSLSPNILAHASLATLDLPITFFVFLTAYALWRYAQQPCWQRMLVLSAALACALATKIQALALMPIVALVLGVSLRHHLSRRKGLAGLLWPWMFLVLVPWIFLNVIYLNLPPRSGHLLPPLFVEALRFKLLHAGGSVVQAQTAYLMGRYSSTGWWYYFPLAILVKTPLPTLALLGLGLLRRPARDSLLHAALPAAAFLGAAMIASVNIGLRHVLIIYPFVFMLAGAGAERLWKRSWRGGVLAILGAWYLWQAATIAPHHLCYFNLLAGGATNGHRFLVDSNYDWGQNDHFLRRYVARRGVAYQINPDPFRPTSGHILVNVNAFYGIYGSGGRAAYTWLRDFEPVDQIAYTWFEYDIPDDAHIDRAALAEQMRDRGPRNPFRPWNENVDTSQLDAALELVELHLHALRERYAEVTAPEFRLTLAYALAWTAAYDSALDELRLILEQDPAAEDALGLGGELMVQWKLGILRFSGDEYLSGVRPAARAAGAAPPDAARVAQAARAVWIGDRIARVHYRLGVILSEQGRIDEAIAQYAQALRFQPDAGLRISLGARLVRQGRFEQGLRWTRQALKADPAQVRVALETALGLSKQDRFDEAIRVLREVRVHVPNDVSAAILLSKLLLTCPQVELRSAPEALRQAEAACRLTNGQDPTALDALGQAYFAVGRIERAIATARRAFELARQRGMTELTILLQNRLARYEQARRGG